MSDDKPSQPRVPLRIGRREADSNVLSTRRHAGDGVRVQKPVPRLRRFRRFGRRHRSQRSRARHRRKGKPVDEVITLDGENEALEAGARDWVLDVFCGVGLAEDGRLVASSSRWIDRPGLELAYQIARCPGRSGERVEFGNECWCAGICCRTGVGDADKGGDGLTRQADRECPLRYCEVSDRFQRLCTRGAIAGYRARLSTVQIEFDAGGRPVLVDGDDDSLRGTIFECSHMHALRWLRCGIDSGPAGSDEACKLSKCPKPFMDKITSGSIESDQAFCQRSVLFELVGRSPPVRERIRFGHSEMFVHKSRDA